MCFSRTGPECLSRGDTWKCTRWARVPPEFEGEVVLPPCFGHPMRRANSLEKTLMLGKIECPLNSKEIKPVNPKGNQP